MISCKKRLFPAWIGAAAMLYAAASTVASGAPNPNGGNSKFSLYRHSFNFPNNFQSMLKVELPHFGEVDLPGSRFGLCGGMISAAHDSYWVESTTARRTDTPDTPNGAFPAQRSQLRQYNWNRQMDRLKKDNWWAVRRLLDWMTKPPNDTKIGHRRIEKGLKTLSVEEFYGKFVPRIDDGWAVPLLLVNTKYGDTDAFPRNHQVLAIGYRLHDLPDGKQAWDIRVYELNCRIQFHNLHTRTRQNFCSKSSRGYFVTRYAGQRPYWAEQQSTTGGDRRIIKREAEKRTFRDPMGAGDVGPDKHQTQPSEQERLKR